MVEKSPDGSSHGYVNYTLNGKQAKFHLFFEFLKFPLKKCIFAAFNTSDWGETCYGPKAGLVTHNVSQCYYRSFTDKNESTSWLHIQIARLVFVAIFEVKVIMNQALKSLMNKFYLFQHLSVTLLSFTRNVIPNVPKSLRTQMSRERIL